MQYAKFPMQYVNVTQAPNEIFSHKGSLSAFDNSGKDSGIDDAFAPFDCKIVWKDNGSAKTGVLIQNTDYVLCADGLIREPNTIKVLLWHDNNISHLIVGQVINQGKIFYHEGTAGHATGNHVHFNVGIGKFDGNYPLVKNEFGVWEIKGEIDPTKIFFVDSSHTVKNTKGMKWIKYVEKEQETQEVSKPIIKDEVKVGDKIWIKQTATSYSSGVMIPPAYKKNGAKHTKPFTILDDGDKKSNPSVKGHWLIKEIVSYVKKKDVEKA